MLNSTRSSARITARRLALWTIELFPMVLCLVILWFWLESSVPAWVYWQTALCFVIAARWAYGVSVAAAIPGTIVLGLLVFRGRRTGHGRAGMARGLILCSSLVLVAIAAEGTSAIWERRLRRKSALPVGALAGDVTTAPEQRFGPPVEEFALRRDFPDPPGDRDIDLVVLGESSAEGVPFSRWLSIGAFLTWKISEAIPGRAIRPRILARPGDTLEWQHRELTNLPRRPDLLVVYCGHNEFTSRLAESRDLDYYFDERLPNTWDMLVNGVERASPFWRLMQRTAEKCRIAIPSGYHGRRRLVDVPLYTMSEYTTLLVDFRRRLEAIVSYGEEVGALVVLIMPAGNDAGFEPSRSFLPAGTSRGERTAFEHQFMAVRRLERVDPAGSMEQYRVLVQQQPGFAETHYRLARLLEQNGEWDESYHHYVAARDLDGYPIRCPSAFQELYREVAARHDCILIDTQSYLHAIGRGGLLDDELFQDAMHPSLRGQIALADAVLQARYQARSVRLAEGHGDSGHRSGGMRRAWVWGPAPGELSASGESSSTTWWPL